SCRAVEVSARTNEAASLASFEVLSPAEPRETPGPRDAGWLAVRFTLQVQASSKGIPSAQPHDVQSARSHGPRSNTSAPNAPHARRNAPHARRNAPQARRIAPHAGGKRAT